MKLAQILLVCLTALLVYMTFWFYVAYKRKRLDVVDVAWGGGFILVAAICLAFAYNQRTLLVFALVTAWGLRLAFHIGSRLKVRGPDRRYAELSQKWAKKRFWFKAYDSVFILQGLLIFAVSAPIMIIASQTNTKLVASDGIAIALWVVGFSFEMIADRQLNKFIRNKANKGKVLKTGLWRFSRHPNYFGELVQWWAIALLALGEVSGLFALFGPAVLTVLIVFISGLPPIEKHHKSKPGYAAYARKTSVLIPWPPKKA